MCAALLQTYQHAEWGGYPMLSVGIVLIGLSSGAAGLCPKAFALTESFVSYYWYLGDATPVAGYYLKLVLKYSLTKLLLLCKPVEWTSHSHILLNWCLAPCPSDYLEVNEIIKMNVYQYLVSLCCTLLSSPPDTMICKSYESWISSTTSAEPSLLCIYIYPIMFTVIKIWNKNETHST